jgi:5-hydroxyisourate hydrolase-like protein (transthyretin family)
MPITLPGDVSTGSYELRLFANDTLTRLATSNGFDVTTNARVSASTISVKSGGTLNVTWAGIASPTATDWVGLVPLNGADNTYVAWHFTTGAASGNVGLTIPASVAPGTYELRLFAQNTFQRLAVGNLIKVGTTLSANPTSAAPGGTLTVTWSGIATPTAHDWLVLVPLNSADNQWVAWEYTDSTASGSKTFVIPSNLAAGSYDVRLFANDTFTRLALSNVITLAPGPSVGARSATGTTTFGGGSTIQAWFGGIAAPTTTDWIGLYPVGAADNADIARVYTGTVVGNTWKELIVPLGATPGQYELRLFSNDTLTRLAVGNSITIQ